MTQPTPDEQPPVVPAEPLPEQSDNSLRPDQGDEAVSQDPAPWTEPVEVVPAVPVEVEVPPGGSADPIGEDGVSGAEAHVQAPGEPMPGGAS